MGNANETSPLGTVRYNQSGTYKLSEPVLDRDGKPVMSRRWVADPNAGTPADPNGPWIVDAAGNTVSGTGPNGAGSGAGSWIEEQQMTERELPIWERVVSLSPEQQALYDRQVGVQRNLLDLANSQSKRLQDVLAKPFSDFDVERYLAANPDVAAAGVDAEEHYNTHGRAEGRQRFSLLPEAVQTIEYGGPKDYSADRLRVEQALYDRLNPQLDRDREKLEAQLVNQGFSRGTEGFQRELDSANRQANDARLGVIAAGGQEQSRLAGLDFQDFQARLAAGQFQNTARERMFQELMARRNAPINEISALLGTSQVQMPQFAPFQSSPMNPTPIGDYVYKSAEIDSRNAQIAAQQKNAAMGGMASLLGTLGGAAITKWSERSLKRGIRRLGETASGLPLYAYRYLWSDQPEIGVMADEVERIMPAAIARHETGLRAVDYDMVMAA